VLSNLSIQIAERPGNSRSPQPTNRSDMRSSLAVGMWTLDSDSDPPTESSIDESLPTRNAVIEGTFLHPSADETETIFHTPRGAFLEEIEFGDRIVSILGPDKHSCEQRRHEKRREEMTHQMNHVLSRIAQKQSRLLVPLVRIRRQTLQHVSRGLQILFDVIPVLRILLTLGGKWKVESLAESASG
jgi:hypothetical protein